MPTKRFSNLSEEKRAMIASAILEEFNRTPYCELKISRIAENAKISRGSIYAYFKNKEDLFLFGVECLHMAETKQKPSEEVCNRMQLIRNIVLNNKERQEKIL